MKSTEISSFGDEEASGGSHNEGYDSATSTSGGKAQSTTDKASTSRDGEDNESTLAGTRKPEAPAIGIAKAEDRAVFRSRLAVVIFLTVCTVSVATLVYFDTRQGEEQQMKEEFDDLSLKVFLSLALSMEACLSSIDSFVVSIVSFAEMNNATWPFITTPHYGVRASKVRAVAKSTMMTQIPIVSYDKIEEWNQYSMKEGPIWVEDSRSTQRVDPGFKGSDFDNIVSLPVWGTTPSEQETNGFVFPLWQSYPTFPILDVSPFNLDTVSSIAGAVEGLRQGRALIGGVDNDASIETAELLTGILANYVDINETDVAEPFSQINFPIFENGASDLIGSKPGKLVGALQDWFFWRDFLVNILPQGSDGLVIVFENGCNHTFSYQINGPDAIFLGSSDTHDPQYEAFGVSMGLIDMLELSSSYQSYTGAPLSDDTCPYTLSVFPSQEFENQYVSSDPAIYTGIAIAIFVFTTLVFLIYDFLVERRQKKVMKTAVKSSAIVSSLFPSNVRDRLYGDDEDAKHAPRGGRFQKSMMEQDDDDGARVGLSLVDASISTGRPIADLFPSATVMFGDIAGFTAWSSTRQPHQVFILLESLYGLFDKIADRRGVFKVETIGDCYMAVAGLPDPRPDHAIVCAKFASECCKRMLELTSKLSVTLGPDTEELTMRFGLNSGPVTAGVLRGQKTRFQLFGDTVNTASRMESTGRPNYIQASETTATEIKKYNKGHWLRTREDLVEVKGKGKMETYWVDPTERASDGKRDVRAPFENGTNTEPSIGQRPSEVRKDRLIDWNTEVLVRLLREIVARRLSLEKTNCSEDAMRVGPDANPRASLPTPRSKLIIDEVKEIVPMAKFATCETTIDANDVELDSRVLAELREYVSLIAKIYANHDNHFHNFEHASHVCMSVAKLLSRIVDADEKFDAGRPKDYISSEDPELAKHHRTFGITSDPLAVFACAFSALIHDADHQGVPNSQLVAEGTDLAAKYHNRSVAEQHSIDVAWTLLSSRRFDALRQTIASTSTELQRFRQLVVNTTMATDIMDKDLKKLRNERWDRAFDVEGKHSASKLCDDDRNRKATIVIEHLIQASDISHTMQHWHVYRKWNERLFMEMSKAFESGRSDKDPADFWYKGELGFFDFYILPLAKKLSDCGVFGVSSDEYLNYAMKNREEWERKGEEIVEGMVKKRLTRN